MAGDLIQAKGIMKNAGWLSKFLSVVYITYSLTIDGHLFRL